MRARLLLCVVLAACAGDDTAPAGRPALTLPPGGARLRVAQRSTAAVPGSDGRVRVHVGDITSGQVQLTLARADGTTLIAPTSVKQGDALPFHLQGPYVVTVAELNNRLLADDYAVLQFSSGRSERSRIEALIAAVESVDVTFLRNDAEHDAVAAAAHLRRKWRHAGDRDLTAEEFIDKIASASSTTGRPYRIRERDGSVRDARDWLRERLAAQDR
ncbi:MAG: DUF5329 family protein [Planctomycetota bacterium]|jgi:hypothetical protein